MVAFQVRHPDNRKAPGCNHHRLDDVAWCDTFGQPYARCTECRLMVRVDDHLYETTTKGEPA